MSNLSIIRMFKDNYDYKGSCLRLVSDKVIESEFGSEWLKNFISDMFETLYSNPSGVGLAANQVGVLKQICVVDIKRDSKKPMVLINPVYQPLGDEMIDSKEVCLSFPAVSSLVKRYKKISVVFQDYYGNERSIVAEGFKAYVLQHEIDHLKGIVHVDLAQTMVGVARYEGYSVKLAQDALDKVLDTGGNCGDEK